MKKNFFHYLLIISWFLLLIKSFLKNNMQNVWRFQKKPYLCIAFETEVYGRLAQLVQSICLTSRGSAVRIRQRPHKIQALSFIKRAFSSAGSEHLPYKQRVGGSNPSTPTGNFHSKVVLQVIVRPFFLSVNFLFLKSLSFMSCYSEKSSNFAVR